ncbi:putative F-box/LRR-repeat protein At5g54820 [Carica papaya]|uniref:putative F-box/LRR-repeat protein At5g54820 n=1 Tax=Carica papaya TaxID=3649 RepID=UPI000B8C9892|nr:putative F-box/LRR-repeat protein At5g54820 [Carica papaya]
MAPGGPIDSTSKLVDEDILLILSRLPFNEAARTSVLAQRWRHIWRGTRSVELLERFFVRPGDSEEIRENKRREFMEFVRQWINDSDRESEIDKFSFSLSNPKPFQDDLYAVLSFPSSRNVKELYLDFSDPSWEQDDPKKTHKAVCNIPGPVYRNHDLQSMKLYSCSFMDQWFGNFGSLKELSLGWIELESASMKAVMEKCPLLLSLNLKRCWNRGKGMEITGTNLKLRKLRIENCGYEWWCFDFPNLKEFKYSGRISILHFDSVRTPVENVELDFGVEKEFQRVGDYLQMLLHDLTSARILTICTYVLQVIPSGMQSLGIYGRSLEGYVPPFELRANDFWINNTTTYKCLRSYEVIYYCFKEIFQ